MLERWDDDFVFEQVGWSEEGVGPWLGDLHSAFNKLFLLCVSLCAGGARVVVKCFPIRQFGVFYFPIPPTRSVDTGIGTHPITVWAG